MLGIGRWSRWAQITFAVVTGIAIGYLQLDGVWFSISRTFVYFPFFVMGYHFSFGTFAKWFQNYCKIAAASFSVLVFVVLAVAGSEIPLGWLYGSMTYIQLEAHEWYAGLYRLVAYALQSIASLAFLGWVPYRVSRMTDWGRRTLYVFLLHGFIVRLAAVSGWYAYIDNAAGITVLLLCTLLSTVILVQPGVKRLLHPLVEPSVDWMITLQRAAIRRIP